MRKTLDTKKPKNVLELACGPARLTAELKGNFKGLATDYSTEMLKVAKVRSKEANANNWTFRKIDAFNPKIKSKFDLVYTFRFIRHFQENKRKKIYSNVRQLLKKDGIFVIDAVNAKKGKWVKLVGGKKRLITFDHLYYKKELVKELEDNGFEVLKIHPIINHFFVQNTVSELSNILKINKVGYRIVSFLERLGPKNNPWEWVAICKKK